MKRTALLLLVIIILLPFLSYADDTDYFSAVGVIRIDPLEAPDFTLKSLDENDTSLSDFKGKVVFLNFWATWCGPCRAEVKDIDKLYETLKDEDFTVMAVDMQESKKSVTSFMSKYDVDFPVYLDKTGNVTSQYGVTFIPTTYIINPEGMVVGWAVGPRQWASMESINLMRSLMSEK
ncbi:MAG: TlpA family protein disulfide reductase [Spirochaetota bacterium]|nr:MAG: TlpA family protein disulfide reductase [Spirochaetota bacterium]